jgi:large subunit ribosomal protein L7/L12
MKKHLADAFQLRWWNGNGSYYAEEVEEKTFNLMLDEVPADKKIAVLKLCMCTRLGLKEAKRVSRISIKRFKEGLAGCS